MRAKALTLIACYDDGVKNEGTPECEERQTHHAYAAMETFKGICAPSLSRPFTTGAAMWFMFHTISSSGIANSNLSMSLANNNSKCAGRQGDDEWKGKKKYKKMMRRKETRYRTHSCSATQI